MKKKQYLLCGVKFNFSGNVYSYLSNKRIEVDDYVVVPVGPTNRKTNAIVVSVKKCYEEQLPFPKKELKKIISKKLKYLYLSDEYFLEENTIKEITDDNDPFAKMNEGKDFSGYVDSNEDNYTCG